MIGAVAYFSGTGGTAYCARLLADRIQAAEGSACCRLIPLDLSAYGRSEKSVQSIDEIVLPKNCNRLILMYPVYAGGPPAPVRRWVESLEHPSAPWPDADGRQETKPVLAAVLSVSAGGALWPNNDCRRRVIRGLELRGFEVDYEDMLVMPSNWTVSTPPKLVPFILTAAYRHIATIAREIHNGTRRRSGFAAGSAAVSWLASLEQRGASRFGRGIEVNHSCSSCGWCSRSCPVGNISMEESSFPVFSDSCVLCMRCLYGCPEGALSPSYMSFSMLSEGFRPPVRQEINESTAGSQAIGDKKNRAMIKSLTRSIVWYGVWKYVLRWLK